MDRHPETQHVRQHELSGGTLRFAMKHQGL